MLPLGMIDETVMLLISKRWLDFTINSLSNCGSSTSSKATAKVVCCAENHNKIVVVNLSHCLTAHRENLDDNRHPKLELL